MKAIAELARMIVAGLVISIGVGCRDSSSPHGNGPKASGVTEIPAELTSLAKRFRVTVHHTNDLKGIVIIDMESNQPIWMEWHPEEGADPDQICFLYGGRPVMELYLNTNGPPRRSIIYYDTNGFESVIVGDRGGVGTFSDRISYESGVARQQWWYQGAWHDVVERDDKRGIVIEGQWTQMTLSNGLLVPKSSE